ncbi:MULTISPECIES: cytochrome c biogenesis CcdA family protein [Actinomadura]|uniref:cytochrome c biogenesis CcdA family protein n=1 Tax=unclassified Actinomadura TaxID=2626254 RepID=UPI003393131A
MIEIGYAGAFLGGLFALISPCSALLLPAFFAYAFPSRTALIGRTLVFYAGLAAVLVPLGLGTGWTSRLVYGHQMALTTIAGALLIGLGAVQILGGGFILPGLSRLTAQLGGDSPAAVLVLGAVSGLTGFCAGPILGAVLTIAATSGTALRGGALLAVYAAGMTAPLFLLAALWDRYDLGRRRWLRGRGVRLGRLRLHTTALASGLVFLLLGVLFLTFGGTQGLTSLAAPLRWETALQTAASAVDTRLPDLLLIAAAIVVVAVVTAWRLRRSQGGTRPQGRER